MVVAMTVNAARACPRLSSGCKRPPMLRRSTLSQARATCLMLVLVARGIAPTVNQTASTQPSPPLPSGTLVPPPYTPAGLGTLTPPGGPPRPAQSALEQTSTAGAGAPSSGILPSGSASDQYNFA